MKKFKSVLLICLGGLFISTANALPASECQGMYNDCMDAWFTTQGGCLRDYLGCRNAPGE